MIWILLTVTVFALIGWLKNRLGLLTLCYYMQKNSYTPPSDAEMKECSRWVIRRLLKL